MTPRGQGVHEILLEALELEGAERASFLDVACGDDATLRARVERLLAMEVPADRFFGATATTADERSAPGASSRPRVPGYELIKPLGEGGMGEVWLAEQREPIRRRVALKVVRAAATGAEVLRRFEAERQFLASLRHPHIAQVHEAGVTEDGAPFFAMELVEGASITVFADMQRLDLHARLRLFERVCGALEHAHAHGVVHRDIKPGNVLVSESDSGPSPKVIDFGIAKSTDRELVSRSLYTEVGQIVGTPVYMSPEQASLDSSQVGPASDVHALGVLLYELLTGETPLDREHLSRAALEEVFRQIREQEPLAPSVRVARFSRHLREERAAARSSTPARLEAELRGDLDWIVLRALEKDPLRRYASAAALATDLARHRANEPVLAGPPTWRYRARKFVVKNRGPVVATSAVLSALLVGLITSAFLYVAMREERDRGAESLERIRRLSVVKDSAELTGYELEAGELWPANESRVEALEEWIEKARTLIERRDGHRTELAEIESGATSSPEASRRAADLRVLLERLDRLADPVDGLLARVSARLQFARDLRARSIDQIGAAWDETIRGVRSSPRYGGLEIVPQLGLVPLGPDRLSGLFEFAYLPSGSVPERDPEGRLKIDASSGIVLVLLRGGTTRIGALRGTPDAMETPLAGGDGDPGDGVRIDEWAEPDESPVVSLELAPYFIAKHEMTQAQWLRIAGENPSHYRHAVGAELASPLRPVERVSWHDATMTLSRLDLVLPSEAQWEHAARGGTDEPWWTGDIPGSLQGAANVADRSLAAELPEAASQCEDFDDGFAAPAPIGSFRANGFGLHDTAGNVFEWCRETYDAYVQSASRDGDGVSATSGGEQRVLRGGGYQRPARAARSADRSARYPDQRANDLGVRPARALDPGPG